MARFSARDSRYRQAVLLRDVPWAIPLQDINSALAKQGIVAGNVERLRQFVRVEVETETCYFPFIRLLIISRMQVKFHTTQQLSMILHRNQKYIEYIYVCVCV